MFGMEHAPVDFSTSCWRELRIGHSRPAVYLAVLAAYLLLTLPLGAMSTVDSREAYLIVGWFDAVALLCALVLSAAAAMSAAARFSRRNVLQALPTRTAGANAGDRRASVGKTYFRVLLASLPQIALAAILLAPLHVYIGWAAGNYEAGPIDWTHVGAATDGSVQAICHCWLWLDMAVSAVVSAMIGALVGHLPRMRWTAPLAATALLIARRWIASVLGDLNGPTDGFVETLRVDFLLSAAIALALLFAGLRILAKRLAAAEDGSRLEVEDPATEYPEGFGLGISFWAIFRWDFLRDPVFRAERQSFWRGSRLLILWTCLIVWFVLWGTPLLGMRSHRVWDYPYVFLQDLLFDILSSPVVWLAPGLMAASLVSDRQTGALDGIMATTVAPLRLALAKLLAKCSHLLITWLAVLVALVLQYWLCELKPGYPELANSWTLWSLFLAMVILKHAFSLAAFAAIGLYFAARVRSLARALPYTYLTMVAIRFVWVFLDQRFLRMHRGTVLTANFLAQLCAEGVLILAALALLSFFLMGAAKHLALRSAEREA